MNRWVRDILFAGGAVGLATILILVFVRLPQFGHYRGPYGMIINRNVMTQRHTPQAVGAVTFDYRGFDTLGEEFILFTAATSISLLMRTLREEEEEPPTDHARDRNVPRSNDAVLNVSSVLFSITLVYGIYTFLHGHLTPGGGFQGGAFCAAAFLYVFLGGESATLERLFPSHAAEPIEAVGAGGFVLIGILGLLAGRAYLQNVLPLGTTGQWWSSGTLVPLNILVGLEVCAAFVLIFLAFLNQLIYLRRKDR